MPGQVGAKTRDLPDPTGLLFDYHRRIEMFLASLRRVAEAIDAPLTDDTRDALETALGDFREAAPKHTKGEKESLFARLRQIHHPDVESACRP